MPIRKLVIICGTIFGVALPALPLFGLVSAPTAIGSGVSDLSTAARGLSESFWLTLGLGFLVSALSLSLGTFLAYTERRFEYAGRRLFASACLLPLAVPSYVLAGTLREMLGPSGLGLKTFSGFWAASFTLTLTTVPLVQLLVSAALNRMPVQEEEAARALGANWWRSFRVATLPRLRPALTYSLLLTQLYVISDFGAVAMLNVPTLTWRLYLAVNSQQSVRAIILGAALFVVSIPLFFVADWLKGKDQRGETVANARQASSRKLPLIATALTYCSQITVISFGAILPSIELVKWVQSGLSESSLYAPLQDTALISMTGAIFTVSCAFFPAWYIARSKSKLAPWLERIVYLSSALPGVLLAFGLLLLALAVSRLTNNSSELYTFLTGSGILLMFGYATRFIAEAYSSIKTNILRLSIQQEEVARALHADWFKITKYITIPALLPGMSTALIISILAIMKELPVTLMLSGTMGLHTLSFRMYDRYQDAFLPDAGWAGLTLVLFALVTVLASLRWRNYA